jgi:hypothetical protein
VITLTERLDELKDVRDLTERLVPVRHAPERSTTPGRP